MSKIGYLLNKNSSKTHCEMNHILYLTQLMWGVNTVFVLFKPAFSALTRGHLKMVVLWVHLFIQSKLSQTNEQFSTICKPEIFLMCFVEMDLPSQKSALCESW